jgi:hypothetical protein
MRNGVAFASLTAVSRERDADPAAGTTVFRLHVALVDDFLYATLDAAREAKLASQVAMLLPFHWTLPNRIAGDLSRLTAKLGGETGQIEWLAGHPGKPRLVANLYELIGLVDQDRLDKAVRLAMATVSLLRQIAPRVRAENSVTG